MFNQIGGALAAQVITEAFSKGPAEDTVKADLLERVIPGFAPIRDLVKRWSGIDIKKLVIWLMVFGGARSCASWIWNQIYRVLIKFCFSSISIPPQDRLNKELLAWMSTHVIAKGARFIAAESSKTAQDDLLDTYRLPPPGRPRRGGFLPFDDGNTNDRSLPVRYYPSVGTQWFFHNGHILIFRRGITENKAESAERYVDIARGSEPLTVMCLGRSPEPIKRFLEHCRASSTRSRESMTTIHVKDDLYKQWGQAIIKPGRPLDTIDMSEDVKDDIVKDISAYLDPRTRRFYAHRGIPYRRGYLLHGPPGTGKSSFCLALAGRFELDLYICNLSSGSMTEYELSNLFAQLPPKCIVLLEDIDSAGIARENLPLDIIDINEDGGSKKKSKGAKKHEARLKNYNQGVSLSGLLNVIDGAASQEGRVLILTTNHPESLDDALIRPGRVDKQVYFGEMSSAAAGRLFMRMFTQEPELEEEKEKAAEEASRMLEAPKMTYWEWIFGVKQAAELQPTEKRPTTPDGKKGSVFLATQKTVKANGTITPPASRDGSQIDGENHLADQSALVPANGIITPPEHTLQELADMFAAKIPDNKLTPAEVQGYLLLHRDAPMTAINMVEKWIKETMDNKTKRKEDLDEESEDESEEAEECGSVCSEDGERERKQEGGKDGSFDYL